MKLDQLRFSRQFERDLLIERTQSGLKRVKSEGKVLGHPSTLSEKQKQDVRTDLATGAGISAIARKFATSLQTIMRVRDKDSCSVRSSRRIFNCSCPGPYLASWGYRSLTLLGVRFGRREFNIHPFKLPRYINSWVCRQLQASASSSLSSPRSNYVSHNWMRLAETPYVRCASRRLMTPFRISWQSCNLNGVDRDLGTS